MKGLIQVPSITEAKERILSSISGNLSLIEEVKDFNSKHSQVISVSDNAIILKVPMGGYLREKEIGLQGPLKSNTTLISAVVPASDYIRFFTLVSGPIVDADSGKLLGLTSKNGVEVIAFGGEVLLSEDDTKPTETTYLEFSTDLCSFIDLYNKKADTSYTQRKMPKHVLRKFIKENNYLDFTDCKIYEMNKTTVGVFKDHEEFMTYLKESHREVNLQNLLSLI